MQMEGKVTIRSTCIHILAFSSMCASCSISDRTNKSFQSYLRLYGSLALHCNSSTSRQIRPSTMLMTACYGEITMVWNLEMKVLLFKASFFHFSFNLMTDQIRRRSSVTRRSFTSTFSFDHKPGGVIIRDIFRALHMSSLDFVNIVNKLHVDRYQHYLVCNVLFCWLRIPHNGLNSIVFDDDGSFDNVEVCIECLFIIAIYQNLLLYYHLLADFGWCSISYI